MAYEKIIAMLVNTLDKQLSNSVGNDILSQKALIKA